MAMDRIFSHGVNFVMNQNLLARIETAQENQSITLNLSCFSVDKIPNEVFDITWLKRLFLDENKLHNLPENIANLKQLQELTVDHNQLSELPKSLDQLINLRHLNLSYNPLKKVPDVIKNLTRLESLWLNHTDLSDLPVSLGCLTQLDLLGARGNNLQEFPPQLCLLTNLSWLTLDGNKLKQLPSEFQNLTRLRHLNLSNNLFDEIPPCLVHIRALQFCLMKQNCVSAISEVILENLKHIKLLDLRFNPVSTKVNRRMYPYIVLESGQTRNTELESSSDSEDYEHSIPSEDINDKEENSAGELMEDVDASILQLSTFAYTIT